jgi:hypothetical protein
MPLAKHPRQLLPEEIDRLQRWIEQGARWQMHWSFVPPRHLELPSVKATASIAAFKVFLWLMILAVLWFTLWARQWRKLDRQATK